MRAIATNHATLRLQLLAQRDELLNRLDAATEDAHMHLPAGKDWSALGHVEHLIVTERGIGKVFQGSVEAAPADRDSAALLARVNQILGNLERSFPAPEAVAPKGRFASWAHARPVWLATRDETLALLEALNPDEVCQSWPHPAFGHLTRREWAAFALLHAARHLQNLQQNYSI